MARVTLVDLEHLVEAGGHGGLVEPGRVEGGTRGRAGIGRRVAAVRRSSRVERRCVERRCVERRSVSGGVHRRRVGAGVHRERAATGVVRAATGERSAGDAGPISRVPSIDGSCRSLCKRLRRRGREHPIHVRVAPNRAGRHSPALDLRSWICACLPILVQGIAKRRWKPPTAVPRTSRHAAGATAEGQADQSDEDEKRARPGLAVAGLIWRPPESAGAPLGESATGAGAAPPPAVPVPASTSPAVGVLSPE